MCGAYTPSNITELSQQLCRESIWLTRGLGEVRRLPRTLRWWGQSPDRDPAETGCKAQALLRLAAKPKLLMANVEATCGSPPVTSWFVGGSDPFPQSQEQWGDTGLAIRRPGFYFVLCHQLAGVLGHDFEILCRPSLRSCYRRTVLCRASCVALSLALSMVLQAPLPAGSASPILRGAGLGSCQEHSAINQQVWNGKLNSKGGREKGRILYGFTESVPKDLSFFFFTQSHVFGNSRHLGLNWTSQFWERSIDLSFHCPWE